MVVQAGEIDRAQQAVLATVGERTSSPGEVIQLLRNRGFNEDLIRGSIWLLLDQGLLNLTWDRQLSVPQAHAA